MKACLLVLDPQNDFFESGNPNLAEFRRVIPRINEALSLFRERGWPVVFVQHTSARKLPGTRAWEIYSDFDCQPEDLRVSKKHKGAFEDTGLDLLLNSQDVDLIIICGFMSEHCVQATYKEALARDYRAAILEGGIASLDDRETERIMQSCIPISLGSLMVEDGQYAYWRWQDARLEI